MSPSVPSLLPPRTTRLRLGLAWGLAVTGGAAGGILIPGIPGTLAASGLLAVAGAWLLAGGMRREKQLWAELEHRAAVARSEAERLAAAQTAAVESAAGESSRVCQILGRLHEAAEALQGNAARSAQADALAGDAREVAERGVRELQAIGDAIEALNSSSGQITQILKTIDGISFQTNLLALNAAVEAARAGEAGAGFAVVAGEVRRLAQDAAESARETNGKVEENVNWIAQCEMLKAELSNTLGEVAGKAREVAALVKEVAGATAAEAGTLAAVVADVDALRLGPSGGEPDLRRPARRMTSKEKPTTPNGEKHHARLD